MRPTLSQSRALAGIAAFGLLLITAGCASDHGASPTAPGTSASGEPTWAYPTSEASEGAEAGLINWLLGVVRSVVQVVLPTESAILEGDIYTLSIPVGALPKATSYSMSYRITGPAQVDLGPHGAEFDVPVALSIDLSGSSLATAPDVTLYWWDEAHAHWVDVGGVWDAQSGTLTSELDHFSSYRPGRAGW